MKIRSFLFPILSLCCLSALAEPVDINTADVMSLEQALTGVGPSKAQAIVDYRDQHGSFAEIRDLLNVPGIGEATLQANQENLTLGGAGEAPISGQDQH